jgi:hypothetical protein
VPIRSATSKTEFSEVTACSTLASAPRRFRATTSPVRSHRFVDKVRKHAYEVVDRDVEELRAAGYSDDQLFELTIAAALGEARRKLDAGLRALRGEL